MDGYKKEIIKTIQGMSGRYSPYNIFDDWVTCSAIAISNACELMANKTWKKREQRYLEIVSKYDKSELEEFSYMLAMLAKCYEEEFCDVLGSVYMEMGIGNKNTGQFFTPYHISYMTAKLAGTPEEDEKGIIRVHEPSCGSGGMIIAAAQVMKEEGIDYQKKMKVVAQDLDWKAVYMCYLQLSLLGIDAILIQGDTLKAEKPELIQVLRTPKNRGMLIGL